MSVALSTIITEVLPDVIGCPYPLVERVVREILQNFCKTTWKINRSVLATTTSEVDVAYSLEDYEICAILELVIDDIEYKAQKLEPVSDLDEMDDVVVAGTKLWYPVTGGKLTLTPFDVAPTEIRLRVAFAPTMSVDTVEDQFYEDHHKAIADGAKGDLMLMPGKPWANPQFGDYFKKKYNSAKSAAMFAVMATLNVTPKTRPVGYL